ncbi:MAG TPA: DUF6680 family protein [Candidatus Acidoferrales bacterium]|nr:DUF6680 family protein [Candidatus Acidoferrales bacterium]
MDAIIATETHQWLGLSLESWLTISAIVIGPFLALLAQRGLDDLREKHNRKLHVFRELMITRSQRVSPRHVEALNAVPLEFGNKGKDKKVIVSWQAYLDHLNTDSSKDLNAWLATGTNRLINLLYNMASRVGFKFEKIRISHEIYLPQLYNTIEAEQTALRQQLLEVLNGTGRRKIPIAVFETKFPDLVDQHIPQMPIAPKEKER